MSKDGSQAPGRLARHIYIPTTQRPVRILSAVSELRTAYDLGYPMAAFALGEAYRRDMDAPTRDFYRRAIDGGVVVAHAPLGWMLWQGVGGQASRGEAEATWKSGAAKGDPGSHEALARLAEIGSGGQGRDLELALLHYGVAARIHAETGNEEGNVATFVRRGSLARLLDPARVAALWPRIRDWPAGPRDRKVGTVVERLGISGVSAEEEHLVALVQKSLGEPRFGSLRSTGILDARTREGIRAFRRSWSLDATGEPSRELAVLLMKEKKLRCADDPMICFEWNRWGMRLP